jgi:AraC family transcriptional regulator
MYPSIENLPAKHLLGINLSMSLADNKTAQLWSSFMRRKQEIQNIIGTELYSLQIYPANYFHPFQPETEFVKWAAVELADTTSIPEGMEALNLPGGLYAVFQYKGLPSAAAPFFQYIFSTWLPSSDYELDNRPHFEVLGEKYQNNSPDSEEEIWIPVNLKPTGNKA